jgi:hypothetical protein
MVMSNAIWHSPQATRTVSPGFMTGSLVQEEKPLPSSAGDRGKGILPLRRSDGKTRNAYPPIFTSASENVRIHCRRAFAYRAMPSRARRAKSTRTKIRWVFHGTIIPLAH